MPTLPVHLVLPRGDAATVLLAKNSLPVVEIEIESEETVVVGLRRALGSQWNHEPTILETYLQPVHPPPTSAGGSAHGNAEPESEPDAHVALAVLEAPEESWSPPFGMRWGRPPSTLPDPVGPRAATWLAELTAGAAPHPLRPQWSRAGWQRRVATWILRSLAEAGRPAAGPIEVRRLWGISALERVATRDGGAVWFKAVFPPFHHEVAVTRLLSAAMPDAVPRVVAADEVEGWLLLDDVAGGPLGWEAPQQAAEAAIRRLVEVQVAMRGREREILRAGAPHRPLATLADDVARAMADPGEVEGPQVGADRLARVLAWVRAQAAWLDGIGLPETLVHGDFHLWNAFGADGRPVIIDWSDAAVTHPLLDIGPWFGHPGAPGDADGYWNAWLDALAALGPIEGIRGQRPRAIGLAAAYQLVSYAGIVRNLEPAVRHQLSNGVRDFWDIVERSAAEGIGDEQERGERTPEAPST